jgi:hypothetical protein
VGPNVPIDEELLKQVNVTSGERGNIGLLRNGGKLNWPLPLQGTLFEEERNRLDKFAPEAIKQLEFNGQVDPRTLEQMRADVAKLNEKLSAREMTPTQYVDARRYINQVEDALTGLSQPVVKNFFNGTYAPKGKSVAELVKSMTSPVALRFAPATQGQEPAYRMLQQRLAAYNMGLEQQQPQVNTAPKP